MSLEDLMCSCYHWGGCHGHSTSLTTAPSPIASVGFLAAPIDYASAFQNLSVHWHRLPWYSVDAPWPSRGHVHTHRRFPCLSRETRSVLPWASGTVVWDVPVHACLFSTTYAIDVFCVVCLVLVGFCSFFFFFFFVLFVVNCVFCFGIFYGSNSVIILYVYGIIILSFVFNLLCFGFLLWLNFLFSW